MQVCFQPLESIVIELLQRIARPVLVLAHSERQSAEEIVLVVVFVLFRNRVEGNFTSRKGIESQSISLHPMGVPHGPHPGTYERSIGHDRTSELAVMCDTFKPLRLTAVADSIEDKDYHYTWVKRENEAMETSK